MEKKFKEFIKQGYSVIPVGADKKPLIPWKEFQSRIATDAEIENWVKIFPQAQIGIVTGKISNIAAVDVETGGDYSFLPQETTIVKTGGGGRHYYFKFTPGVTNSTRTRPLVDVRGEGGYVVAPGSQSTKGKYEWIKQVDKLLDFPVELFILKQPDVKSSTNTKTTNNSEYSGVAEGQRNDAMARYIGSLLNRFHPYEWESLAWPETCAANQKNKPPLDEAELRGIFDSIIKADINSEGENKDGRPKKAKMITSLLLDMGITPFLDQYKQPYVSLTGDGSSLFPINSSEFNGFIAAQLYKHDISASRDTIEQVKNNLFGKAFFEKKQYTLSIRVAKDKNGDYLYDLGDGKIALIKDDSWTILNKPPILFRYMPEQISQPLPVDGGSLDDLFQLINVKDQNSKLLLKVMTIAGFIPGFPHPILVLHGQKGSAKSTCLRLLKSIIDPSTDDLLSPIKNTNIIWQTLSHHWFTCFDNLSYLSRDMSDNFCQICTGAAHSTRQLYKDDSNIVRKLQSMIALNGINNIIVNHDLFERSVIIELKPISGEERKTEEKINSILEKIKPGVLGYCLKAAARAIKIKSDKDEASCRMADFAVWGSAIAEAIGEKREKFLETFQLNYDNQDEIVIEASPLAQAIIQLIVEKNPAGITATAETILSELNGINNTHHFAEKNDRAWPANSRILGRKFFELIPLLEKIGLKITYTRRAERFKSIIPTDKFWKRQELIKEENQQDAGQITEPELSFTDEPNDNNDVSDVSDMKKS